MKKTPFVELEMRLNKLKEMMDATCREWQVIVIFSKINQFYFTGTMQDGVLVVEKDNDSVLWVRRSYERALDESNFKNIKRMESFKDISLFTKTYDTLHIEKEVVPIMLYERFVKYLPFKKTMSVDKQIASVRSVKSNYELEIMKNAGKIHKKVLEDIVPYLFEEGMTEANLAAELFLTMIKEGHHGVSRFSMFDTELLLGHIGFGESSIYPTAFNGPGGNYGMGPAVPIFGSRERKLQKGDLVFIDIGCGVDGYHTDKTMTYVYKGSLSPEAVLAHKRCLDIQNHIASMLKPGSIPEEIYNTVMNDLDNDFLENFMGFGNRKVKFLGHGIGLHIDEYPVIAKGFTEPLEEGMVIALEPKKGIENVGMVGVENTFLVTKEGGICITGDNEGLISI